MVEGLPFCYYVEKMLGPLRWMRMLWKLFASAAAMFVLMWALWPVNALLALGGGIAVYGIGVWGLGTFGPEERAVFAKLRRARTLETIEAVEKA